MPNPAPDAATALLNDMQAQGVDATLTVTADQVIARATDGGHTHTVTRDDGDTFAAVSELARRLGWELEGDEVGG